MPIFNDQSQTQSGGGSSSAGGSSISGNSAIVDTNVNDTYLGGGTVYVSPVNNGTAQIAFEGGFALYGNTKGDDGVVGNGMWDKGIDWAGADLNVSIPDGGAMQVNKPLIVMGANVTRLRGDYEAPSPTSFGRRGEMIVANGYLYHCIDTDMWVRTPFETSW